MRLHLPFKTLGVALVLAALPSSLALASSGGFTTKTGAPLSQLATASQNVVTLCFDGFTVISERTDTVDAEGYFRGSVPTSSGLRVRIENKTSGLSDTPYSDRAYDSGNGLSEYIRFRPGARHRTSAFTVLTPERGSLVNTFEFRTYRSATGEVVDSGRFDVEVSHEWLPERVIYGTSPICNPFPPNPLPPRPIPPIPPIPFDR